MAKLLPSSSTSTPSRFASSADPPPPWTPPPQLAGGVGGMADEVFQRRAEAVWVSLEPVGEELQHLRQLGCVGGVQGHSGHEVAAFSVPGVGASVRAGTVACLPAWGADTSSGTPSVSE